MRAFFLSVSASFSTTFCFWAAINSFVFSLSLMSQKKPVTKCDLAEVVRLLAQSSFKHKHVLGQAALRK